MNKVAKMDLRSCVWEIDGSVNVSWSFLRIYLVDNDFYSFEEWKECTNQAIWTAVPKKDIPVAKQYGFIPLTNYYDGSLNTWCMIPKDQTRPHWSLDPNN